MVIYTMLDLSRIEGFDWDHGNARKSVEKHGVGQGETEQVFFNDPLLVVEDAGCMRWAAPTPGGCFTSASRCAARAG